TGSPERNILAVLAFRSWAKKSPLGFGDGHVVDAGLPPRHQALGGELPQLVAVTAVPLTAGVMALVLEPHGNPVLPEPPQALAQHVIEFALPLGGEEIDDLRAPDDVLL